MRLAAGMQANSCQGRKQALDKPPEGPPRGKGDARHTLPTAHCSWSSSRAPLGSPSRAFLVKSFPRCVTDCPHRNHTAWLVCFPLRWLRDDYSTWAGRDGRSQAGRSDCCWPRSWSLCTGTGARSSRHYLLSGPGGPASPLASHRVSLGFKNKQDLC